MARQLLEILVTGDTRGAVRELEKVGTAADREMGKARSATDKWASRLTAGGAAAVGFAAVAGAGLYRFAQASEEARIQQLKLDTAVANSTKITPQAKREFEQLAEALMQVTVADDDAIKASQAVLVQMGLEADQIKQLTPLVVDLARAKGIDLDVAAKAVARSVDGTSTALRRMGINIDESRFKTDTFGATMAALSGSVGGFAENEGKTFSGQLQILKNQLGEVAEGIGVGVVDAVSNLVGPLQDVSKWFGELSPAAQSSIGKVATFGTVAVGAVGAVSFLAGQTLKMRDRFLVLDAATGKATGGLTGFGKAAAGVGGALAIAGAIVGVASALDALTDSGEDAAEAVERLGRATDRELVNEFATWGREVGVLGNELGGAGLALDSFERLASDSLGTAQRMRDALAEAGEDVSELDKVLLAETASQARFNADMQSGSDAVDGFADSTTDGKAALDKYRDTLEKVDEQLDRYTDALFGSRDAQRDSVQATLDLADATAEYNALASGGAATSAEQTRAFLAVQAAIDEVATSAAAAATQQATLEGRTLTAKDAANVQADALRGLLGTYAPGSPFRAYLEQLIRDLDNVAKARTGSLSVVVSSNLPPGVSLGAALNGSTVVKGKAAGGPVSAGTPYVVGEQGPELFVPNASGSIVPNHALATATPVAAAPAKNVFIFELDGRVVAQTVVDVSNNAGGLPIRIRAAS